MAKEQQKPPIAINRETGQPFGEEPYNKMVGESEPSTGPSLGEKPNDQGIDLKKNERSLDYSGDLRSGEFGDTASTVAAGEALGRARSQQEEKQKDGTTKSPLIPARKYDAWCE